MFSSFVNTLYYFYIISPVGYFTNREKHNNAVYLTKYIYHHDGELPEEYRRYLEQNE